MEEVHFQGLIVIFLFSINIFILTSERVQTGTAATPSKPKHKKEGFRQNINLLKAFILATFLHSRAAGIVSRCDFTYLSKSRIEPCHTKGEGGTEMLLSASPKREM